jgi:hypothetical protein
MKQPRRGVDFHNVGAETQNGAVAGLKTNGRRFESQNTDPHQREKSDPNPHQSEKRDPDPQHWYNPEYDLSLPYLSAIFPRTEN